MHLHSDLRASFSVGDYIQVIDKDPHTIPSQDDTPATIPKHEIRRVIAVPTSGEYIYVDEPFLFTSSIRDNIAYARPDASEKEGIEAAQAAGAAAGSARTCLPVGHFIRRP